MCVGIDEERCRFLHKREIAILYVDVILQEEVSVDGVFCFQLRACNAIIIIRIAIMITMTKTKTKATTNSWSMAKNNNL